MDVTLVADNLGFLYPKLKDLSGSKQWLLECVWLRRQRAVDRFPLQLHVCCVCRVHRSIVFVRPRV